MPFLSERMDYYSLYKAISMASFSWRDRRNSLSRGPERSHTTTFRLAAKQRPCVTARTPTNANGVSKASRPVETKCLTIGR